MTDDGRKLANLMGMAATAERGGNHAEAVSYYNRVLEEDPEMTEAWLGKGRNAGWQSTLASLRLQEARTAFELAIGSVPEEDRPQIARRAYGDLLDIVPALFKLAEKHRVEHNARGTFINVACVLSDTLHETEDWDRDNTTALRQIIKINRSLLNVGINDKLAVLVRERLAAAERRLAELEPKEPIKERSLSLKEIERHRKADRIAYVAVAIVLALVLLFALLY